MGSSHRTGTHGPWRYGQILMSTLALMLVAAGCGGSEEVAGDTQDDEQTADSTGEVAEQGSEDAAADPIEELYQQALDEGGEVVLYTHVSAAEQRENLAAAFEERFPGMRVEHTGAVGQQLLERFLTEKRSGLHTADVFQYPGLAPFEGVLAEEGFLEPYTPTSSELYDEEGTFIEGLAYPWSVYHMGACYNPDMLDEEEVNLLHSYEGWTDPTWQGRANIVAPTGGTYLRSTTYWVMEDPELGEEWLADMAALEPTVFNSANPATDRVIAGEYAVSFNAFSATAARQAEFGAPLRCTFAEYAVAIPAPMALASDAPNPAGGRLWIEWQLSEEGQVASQNATKNLSARAGMEDIPPVDVDWWENPSELRAPDEDIVAEHQEFVTDLFARLFGGLGEE